MPDLIVAGGKHSRFSSWGAVAVLIAWFLMMFAVFVWFDPPLQQKVYSAARRLVGLERLHGFLKRTYFDTDGTSHSYMVFVPEPALKAVRPPLVVYLNGYGENGSDCLAPLKNGLAPAIWQDERTFPFVVVWPLCDAGDQWTHGSRSSERALAIMRSVAEEFQTAPDQVYLTGISAGGTGAWAIAAGNADLFAGIMPMSAAASASDVRNVAEAHLPVWSFCVTEDKPEFVKVNRQVHQTLLQAGISSRLTEVSVKGNVAKDAHDAWSFAFRDGGMYRWMASQRNSHRQSRDQRFELVDLTAELGSFISGTKLDNSFFKVARIPPMIESVARMKGTQASGQNLAEVHLEFRATGNAARFGVGCFTPRDGHNESASVCELSLNDVNSSGLYSWPDQNCITPANPLAEHCVYTGGWNDLRIKYEQSMISVELNGWSLLGPVSVNPAVKDSVLGFVVQGEPSGAVEIRNVRVRRVDPWDVPATQSDQGASSLPELANRGSPLSFTSDRLDTIIEDWGNREKSCPQAEYAWGIIDSDGYADSRIDSRAEVPQKQVGLSQITVTPDEVHFSALWKHPRINLRRHQGFKSAARLQDYHLVRASAFASPPEYIPHDLQLNITMDSARRIDEVSESNGKGYLGIEFKQKNVWQDRVGELDDVVWRGPLLAFRPLSGIGIQLDRCSVLPEPAWVAGVQCLLIEETTENDGGVYRRRFWVDPSRGSVVLRQTVSVDDRLRELLDIQYEFSQPRGWRLSSWEAVAWPYAASSVAEFQFPGDEWLFKAASCKGIDNVPNTPLHRSNPHKHFQPGSVVYSQRGNEWFQQDSAGGRRKLAADEASAMSMDGRLPMHQSDLSRVYKTIGGGTVLLVVGWSIVRRRRRRLG